MGTNDVRPGARECARGFDALYAASAPDVARYAYLLTASPRRAARVTHRAFATLWRDQPDVDDTPADTAYVRTLAGDLALHRGFLLRRGVWRIVPHVDRTGRVVAHASDDTHRERDIALLRALQRVPGHRRRVFVLRHLFGLGAEEVAVETEATTEATRVRLFHAHEGLAERVPALTGPSPNCSEAHDFLSMITRDLAGRHQPRLRGAQTIRAGSRTRTITLIAVVVAAVVALFAAALPRVLDPGSAHDSRGAVRVRTSTQSPPAPLYRPPVPPAAAPPAPADTADASAPAVPATPEPPTEPSAPVPGAVPPTSGTDLPPATDEAPPPPVAPTAPEAPVAPERADAPAPVPSDVPTPRLTPVVPQAWRPGPAAGAGTLLSNPAWRRTGSRTFGTFAGEESSVPTSGAWGAVCVDDGVRGRVTTGQAAWR
jgi:DNA-directed RNA polymerase specialized sigma24 family protein